MYVWSLGIRTSFGYIRGCERGASRHVFLPFFLGGGGEGTLAKVARKLRLNEGLEIDGPHAMRARPDSENRVTETQR